MALKDIVAKHLNISLDSINKLNVVRRSIDARKTRGVGKSNKKSTQHLSGIDIRVVYNLHVELKNKKLEEIIAKRKDGLLAKILVEHEPYSPVFHRPESPVVSEVIDGKVLKPKDRPIVIGSGEMAIYYHNTIY